MEVKRNSDEFLRIQWHLKEFKRIPRKSQECNSSEFLVETLEFLWFPLSFFEFLRFPWNSCEFLWNPLILKEFKGSQMNTKGLLNNFHCFVGDSYWSCMEYPMTWLKISPISKDIQWYCIEYPMSVQLYS